MKRFFGTLMKLVVLMTSAGMIAHAQTSKPAMYNVSDLGTLGGAYSNSYTINDGGLVGGGAATPAQTDGFSQTAFIWSKGQITNLGTLGGAACPTCNSVAAGTNATG